VLAAIDVISSAVGKVASIGSNMISSLANSISAGAAAVIEAITGVVTGGIDAAKKLLNISSPSRVFMDIGANTAEGMALGVEGGAARVRGALTDMAAPEIVANASPSFESSGGSKGGGDRSVVIDLRGNTFGGDLTEGKIREWFTAALHVASLQLDGEVLV